MDQPFFLNIVPTMLAVAFGVSCGRNILFKKVSQGDYLIFVIFFLGSMTSLAVFNPPLWLYLPLPIVGILLAVGSGLLVQVPRSVSLVATIVAIGVLLWFVQALVVVTGAQQGLMFVLGLGFWLILLGCLIEPSSAPARFAIDLVSAQAVILLFWLWQIVYGAQGELIFEVVASGSVAAAVASIYFGAKAQGGSDERFLNGVIFLSFFQLLLHCMGLIALVV